MPKRKVSLARKLHKWPGIIISLFLMLFAVSGIFMNHREMIAHVDIPRKALPASYHYQKWNLAAAKGSYVDSDKQWYLYGETGIWKTDSLFQHFALFSAGIPQSADHLKTYDLLEVNHTLYAATLYGLYVLDDEVWHKIDLPVPDNKIVALEEWNSTLYVLTRSNLLRRISGELFEVVYLPAPENYKKELSLFLTLWDIHSGEFLGLPGRLFVDMMGLITIFLAITGLLYFLHPRFRKRFSFYKKHVSNKVSKYSLKYHNLLGNWTFVAIGIIALTGIFLRPPLLIPIANTTVPVIPFTHYNSPNPWYDKLRDMLYDPYLDQMLIATNNGIYQLDSETPERIKRFAYQPDVSVMGITVFELISAGDYLVGSFSGLYRWIPEEEYIMDMTTLRQVDAHSTTGSPFGGTAVSGFAVDGMNHAYLFDYDKGVGAMGHDQIFGNMPQEISDDGSMSLWNVSLEVHTGRIYSNILGAFYILIVPLIGLFTIVVLLTGYVIYKIRYVNN